MSCKLVLFLQNCEKLNVERYNEFEAFLKHPKGPFLKIVSVLEVN